MCVMSFYTQVRSKSEKYPIFSKFLHIDPTGIVFLVRCQLTSYHSFLEGGDEGEDSDL